MLVGFHEMAGNREKGCWRHSILPHPITRAYSAVEGIWLNDLLVGEIGIFVAFAGIHNVPAVLNTGDYWACLEAEDLVPGIETVAVKKGTSHFSAISMTPQAAAEAAAEGAVRALGKIGTVVEPLKMEGPVTLKVKYTFAERATDAMSSVANAFRVDEQTVAATYPSIAAVRDNLGNLRAPEMEIYAKGLRLCPNHRLLHPHRRRTLREQTDLSAPAEVTLTPRIGIELLCTNTESHSHRDGVPNLAIRLTCCICDSWPIARLEIAK